MPSGQVWWWWEDAVPLYFSSLQMPSGFPLHLLQRGVLPIATLHYLNTHYVPPALEFKNVTLTTQTFLTAVLTTSVYFFNISNWLVTVTEMQCSVCGKKGIFKYNLDESQATKG